MSLRFRIAFATACAALAALLCISYASKVRAEAEQLRADAIARYGGEVAHIVVASTALEPGDVIGPEDVNLRDWVTDLVPEGAFTDMDSVVGREVTMPVARNAPLSELAFRDEGHVADVPAGHVAVSVPITDKLGISRAVSQGSRLIAYEAQEGSSSPLAQDIEVLSSPAQANAVSTQQIVLAVRYEDVSSLLSASASGDLRLVIPADDVGDVQKPSSATEASAPEPVTDGLMPGQSVDGAGGVAEGVKEARR